MATGLNRERQKQKNDLLFKYVKSMNSFNEENQSQEGLCRSALQRFYQKVALEDKQKSIGIRSKVFELTIKNDKSKRVKFLNEVIVNNGKGAQGKSKQKVGKYYEKHQPNPEQIKKDLQDLQKSVFSIFKIQGQSQESPVKRMFETMPEVSSLMLQSTIEKNKMDYKCQTNRSRNDYDSGRKMLRSNSDILTSSRLRQKSSKNSIRQKKDEQDSSASKKTNNQVIIGPNTSESGLSRGISESYLNLVKKGTSSNMLSSKNSSSLTRSDSFWKQQNNLMVQIFRNKLNFSGKK